MYENYSKFITATDTIRRMKANVEEMGGRMDELQVGVGPGAEIALGKNQARLASLQRAVTTAHFCLSSPKADSTPRAPRPRHPREDHGDGDRVR